MRIIRAIALAAVLARCAFAAPAAKPEQPSVSVVRVISYAPTAAGDSDLIAVPAAAGNPLLKLHMSDAITKKFVALKLPFGALLKLTVRPGRRDGSVVDLDAYDASPKLAAPHAWVYDGPAPTANASAQSPPAAIKLSKYEVTRVVNLPVKTAAGGKPAVDPDVLEKLKSFNPGDVVEVEMQLARTPSVLLDIDAYREPRRGEFVKLVNVQDAGKVLQGVVLIVDDKPTTFLLPQPAPAAPPSAVTAVANARRLKPGYPVLFTTRDGGPAVAPTLRELRVDAFLKPVPWGYDVVAPFAAISCVTNAPATHRVNGLHTFGHPEDAALDEGTRLIATFPDRAANLGIAAAEQAKLKKIWFDYRSSPGYTLTPEEERPLLAAYVAWHDAKDPAQREKAEQQLYWLAVDASQRQRVEMESHLALFRGFYTVEQLKEVIKMGTH